MISGASSGVDANRILPTHLANRSIPTITVERARPRRKVRRNRPRGCCYDERPKCPVLHVRNRCTPRECRSQGSVRSTFARSATRVTDWRYRVKRRGSATSQSFIDASKHRARSRRQTIRVEHRLDRSQHRRQLECAHAPRRIEIVPRIVIGELVPDARPYALATCSTSRSSSAFVMRAPRS